MGYILQWLKPYRGWRNSYQDLDGPATALFLARKRAIESNRVHKIIDAQTGELLATASPKKWAAWEPKILRDDLRAALDTAKQIDLSKPLADLRATVEAPPPESPELRRSAEAGRGPVTRG